MKEAGGFTEAVRQELSRLPVRGDARPRAELSGLVRLAGTLHVPGGDAPLRLEIATTSGAVARRAFSLLGHRFGIRPELMVRAPGGVRRRTLYGVHIAGDVGRIGEDLGILDGAGRPVDAIPPGLSHDLAVAYVRGTVLAAATISHPGRAPHFEMVVDSEAVAHGIAGLVRELVGGTVSVLTGDRTRLVMKSGERIGDLLTIVGASRAFLDWDDRRLRRQLRGEANRLANADNANLRRSIDASWQQVRLVEHVVAALGWSELDEDLRGVALARLANPEASLAELGELLDPPVGKSAVHRRLRRLALLASRMQVDPDLTEGAPSEP